jgi:2'-5' RNA ligase
MALDHFEKHFYKNNQIDWNFNVLFDGQPAVTAMAEQYAKIIQYPGLYKPIPPQWLHATILRVGLIDDYSEAEMLAVAAKLQQSLAELNLPQFSFDSWWLWGGNVTLHISPDDEFTKIYDHVIAALESVVGPDRTAKSPHGNFVAHTTLAYTKTHDKEQEIHAQLVASPIKPASFSTKNLSLIKQWPTAGHYEWEVIKEIPIGQA